MTPCIERVFRKTWYWSSEQCNKPAKFIYQPASIAQPLCGRHARRFRGSPSLRALEAPKKPRRKRAAQQPLDNAPD